MLRASILTLCTLLFSGFLSESARANTNEHTIRLFFELHGAPVLAEVSRCESGFQHYEEDGSPLMNREGSSATGAMQIMASVHREDAAALGHDITELLDNLSFALHLYGSQGLRPWKATEKCWRRYASE